MQAKWSFWDKQRLFTTSITPYDEKGKNNDFDCDKGIIECHQWTRLVLMQFLVIMLEVIHPEECKQNYDYKEKGLKQDDAE